MPLNVKTKQNESNLKYLPINKKKPPRIYNAAIRNFIYKKR